MYYWSFHFDYIKNSVLSNGHISEDPHVNMYIYILCENLICRRHTSVNFFVAIVHGFVQALTSGNLVISRIKKTQTHIMSITL